ncbi:uncharacterized protein LOC103066343 isoform X2 [Python bivittatus]|uniref:Uncharacterized protein LOC103066343 isoform X2 n=1 Tax=Python bivittatus TaxID=176946 RepID=A0A9F5JFC9_PYTBI|nr:uncharacterized protein LOC103066343 isoform X2 [Python bivittatus]
MVPIRHNDNSPALCKTTGNKDAKPPDPKDIPPNSSLLKALEAIVAAGRRGLLGPAAMVAAESVPALNLEGSNGVASQEDLNPIPLVAGLEKRKKTVNEKRRAVITVVSSAEESGRWCDYFSSETITIQTQVLEVCNLHQRKYGYVGIL